MAEYTYSESIKAFCTIASAMGASRDIPVAMDHSFWNIPEKDEVLDGEVLYRFALYHKAIEDLHSQLDSPLLAQLPEAIREKINHRHLLEHAAKQMLAHHWKLLHAQLEHNDIPSMVVKGPASSIQLYHNATIRGFTDLDILVDIPSLISIVPIFEQVGYHLKSGVSRDDHATLFQKSHHLVFIRNDSPFRIEVHNVLFDEVVDPEYATKDLFTRSTIVYWNEIELPTLSPTDQAIFILAHGTHHGWKSLHWLVDIAAILTKQNPIFHDELSRKMLSAGRGKQLALAYKLCRTIFPIPLPPPYEPLVTSIKSNCSYQMECAKIQLCKGAAAKESLGSIINFTYRHQLPMARTGTEKLEVALKLFKIAPQDAKTLVLPDWLLPLHILLRPFFVMKRRIAQSVLRRRNV